MFQLQTLRSRKHINFAVKILFALIIVSFVFFYGWQSSQNQGSMVGDKVARVKTDSLNPLNQWHYFYSDGQEINLAYKQLVAKRGRYIGQISLPNLDQYIESTIDNDQVFDELGNRQAIAKTLQEVGIEATTQEVVQALQQAYPGITDDMLDRLAYSSGFASKHDFVEAQRQEFAANRLLRTVGTVAHASLFELWQEYSIANDMLTLRLAGFPAKDFEDQVVASDEQLLEYLEANPERFEQPAKRIYNYVKLDRDTLLEEIEVSDDQLNSFYIQNQPKYLKPAQFKVEELYVPLLADTSTTMTLAVLNEEYTSATQTADWAGFAKDLRERREIMINYRAVGPWIEEGTAIRSEQYINQIADLTTGAVSQPIVESNGIFLVRLLDKQAGGLEALEAIKDQVQEDYKSEQFEDLFKEAYLRLKETQEQGSFETINDFASAVGLDAQTTTETIKTNLNIAEIGNLSRDQNYVLNLAVGELSEPLRLNDSLAVIQVVNETPAYTPTLADVREDVLAAYAKENAIDLAEAAATQAFGLVEAGADFDESLASAPIPPRELDPVSRIDPIEPLGGPLQNFTQQSLGLKVGDRGMVPYGVNEDNPAGYAIWELVAIDPASREAFNEERFTFANDYLMIQREAITRAWLDSEREKIGFEVLDNTETASAE